MATKTNVTINEKAYYKVYYEAGVDSNGKRVRKQFYGKSKKEAESKKQAYIDKLNNGIVDKKLYLGSAMKSWLFEVVKVGQIKASSFARYEGIYSKYIKESPISHLQLDKIESIDIQRYYNSLYKEGKSSNIIKNTNKLLKQFFNYCIDNSYIIKNPCSGKKLIIPKDTILKEKKSLPVFSNDEMSLIIKRNEDSKISYISLISYATGMRLGEIIGLKESDIDYENKEIYIRRSVVTSYIYDDEGNKTKETFIDSTKTYESERDIPLPDSLIPIIKRSILIKKKDIIKAGTSYNEDNIDMIFLSENGNLINAGNIEKSWCSFLKRCGVAHKKFHALRHTYATLQFENDKPLLTISKLLGHASIDVTASTYTHVLKKEKQKAIDTLELLKLNLIL